MQVTSFRSARRTIHLCLVVALLAGLSAAGASPALAAGTWSPTGSMGVERFGYSMVNLSNGKVLAVGGGGTDTTHGAETYDPASGTWSFTGPTTVLRMYPAVVALSSGKILSTGGYCVGSCSAFELSSSELFDPSSRTWSATGSMAFERFGTSAIELDNGKVLIAGGYSPDGPLASSELYDPASQTWSATGPMATPRFLHSLTKLNDGKILAAGGETDQTAATESAEIYDPATGTWSPTGAMPTGRASHTATKLNTGKILVAGGSGDTGPLATSTLYDPASKTWSTGGSMQAARSGHTSTKLSDGRVVVAGGSSINRFSGLLSSVEIYDPGTNAWSSDSSMSVARYEAAATLLPSGKVLVAGGTREDAYSLSSAELFTPGAPPSDADGDGVPDSSDACPSTPSGTAVDSTGCSTAQLNDTDSDGVTNSNDLCAGTASGATVNASGCSAEQADTDKDGVKDSVDACPGTASGATVNTSGCSEAQQDSDGDTIKDGTDNCKTIVNTDQSDFDSDAQGDVCDADDDNDGVGDSADAFPKDAAETKDSDGDGIGDNADSEPVDQTDSDGDGVQNESDKCATASEDMDGLLDSDGCPDEEAETSLTFEKKAATVGGRIDLPCDEGRKVILKKKRAGADLKLAATTSDSIGRFKFALSDRWRGAVYVIVKQKIHPASASGTVLVCRQGKSTTVRL